MMKRLEAALAATPQNATLDGRVQPTSRSRGLSATAAIALVIGISACASFSERGASPPPLETVPETPWGTAVVDIQFYELRESSRVKLRDEIRSARAVRGMRSYGNTQWRIRTSYDFTTSGDDCEPTRADVSLELRVTLPRLRNSDALSPELRTEWRKFTRALREHQANHKQIAIECAERVSTGLTAVDAMRCDRLAETMQSITEEITSTCHAQSADYDLRTGHGASEGATF
jgi:predicted secreted Zn-dependent protease